MEFRLLGSKRAIVHIATPKCKQSARYLCQKGKLDQSNLLTGLSCRKKVYMYIHRYSYYHYYIVWLFLGFLCRGVFGPTEVPHNGVVWGTIRHNTPKQWTPTYVIKPPKWNCGSPDIPRPQILGMVPHNHRDWISSCNITVLFWDQAI